MKMRSKTRNAPVLIFLKNNFRFGFIFIAFINSRLPVLPDFQCCGFVRNCSLINRGSLNSCCAVRIELDRGSVFEPKTKKRLLFFGTSGHLTSTGWVRSTIKLFCTVHTLSSGLSKSLSNIKNSGTPRIKPGAAGWAQTLPQRAAPSRWAFL